MKPLVLAAILMGAALTPGWAAQHCNTAGNQLTQEFTRWVNDLRAERGLGPLKLNPALNKAAGGHVCDMAANNFLSHGGSNGSNLKTRLNKAGYRLSTATENIARSSRPTSAATAARLWLNSEGHLKNLLHPSITEMGLAIAQGEGQSYYVFVGAKPR